MRINSMDDMHLKNKDIFLEYYNKMQTRDIAGSNDIFNNNPEILDQILNSENVNELIDGVYINEKAPMNDIDGYLSELNEEIDKQIDDAELIGEYQDNKKYFERNFVTYNDKLYFAKDNPPIGTRPTNTSYWLEFDLKGFRGYGGITNLTYKGNWNSATSYNINDMVAYKNRLWVASAVNTDYPPNSTHYPWEAVVVPSPAERTVIQTQIPEKQIEGDLWYKITSGGNISQDHWFTFKSENTPRFASASFMIGNNIYVVGGQTAYVSETNVVEAYDTLTDTWSTKANYPMAIEGSSAFVIDNIGYCAGGMDNTLTPTDKVYSYNPTTNVWTQKANLPIAQAALNGGVDQLGVVIGGLTMTGISSDIYMYDENNDSWTLVATAPVDLIGRTCVWVGTQLYLIGGADISENISGRVDSIDTLAWQWGMPGGQWSTRAEMINPRYLACGFQKQGTFGLNNYDISVVGGLDFLGYSCGLHDIYNTRDNKWYSAEPMKHRRNSLNCAFNSKYAYIIGGIDLATLQVNGYLERYTLDMTTQSTRMVVDLNLGNDTISIPMVSGGNYNYYVNWGDDTASTDITTYNDSNATHTYKSKAEYIVKLQGDLDKLKFTGNIAKCLTQFYSQTSVFPSLNSAIDMFKNCESLTTVGNIILADVPTSENLNGMFEGCTKLEDIGGFMYRNNPSLAHDISFEQCPLTYQSLINISNSLVTLTSSTKKTLKLGNDNLEKLSDIEKLVIINKFWNLPGYTINIVDSRIAEGLVQKMYGNSGTVTSTVNTTDTEFYVNLIDVNTTVSLGYYIVNRTTGLVTEF